VIVRINLAAENKVKGSKIYVIYGNTSGQSGNGNSETVEEQQGQKKKLQM
jgi:hypothetical protein